VTYYIIYGWDDCPFCESAKDILQERGLRHMYVSLDHDDGLLEHFKHYYDWPTVPIIVKKHMYKNTSDLIGGYTDLCKHLDEQ